METESRLDAAEAASHIHTLISRDGSQSQAVAGSLRRHDEEPGYKRSASEFGGKKGDIPWSVDMNYPARNRLTVKPGLASRLDQDNVIRVGSATLRFGPESPDPANIRNVAMTAVVFYVKG